MSLFAHITWIVSEGILFGFLALFPQGVFRSNLMGTLATIWSICDHTDGIYYIQSPMEFENKPLLHILSGFKAFHLEHK